MFFHQIIYESKSCCRMRFYMAESFLITHLADRRPPERWRKFAQTSLISQTVVMLLKNFFSSRLSRFSPTKKKNQVETLFGGKVDSEICYLNLQVAPTVCQILNLSWLHFSPQTFQKTNQICIFNNIYHSNNHNYYFPEPCNVA